MCARVVWCGGLGDWVLVAVVQVVMAVGDLGNGVLGIWLYFFGGGGG